MEESSMRLRVGALVAVLALAVGGACAGEREPRAGSRTPSSTATSPTANPTATTPAVTVTGTPVPSPTVTGTPVPSPTVTVAPVATPTQGPSMDPSVVRLKYILFDRFGTLWYCDPDFYPIARQDEQTLAAERLPQIEADTGTWSIILAHLEYTSASQYTAAQQLAIYRDWKMLRALQLDPVSGGYHVKALFTHDQRTGVLVEGTINANGQVTVTSQTNAGPPNCPICLARGTQIATPYGPVAVEALRPGMTVWTAGDRGLPVVAAVLTVESTPVPTSHQMVHLVLADRRELRASPAHPLSDGRSVGALVPGDAVDGSVVVSADRERYDGDVTFDLLPAGPTGTYWADGIPLVSTLAASLSVAR